MSTFLSQLCGGRLDNIENISHDDPLYKSGKWMESTFTELVDRLRNPETCKCPAINDLMTLCWRLVGNRIVPASIMPSMKTLGFWCEIKGDEWFATIICPGRWAELLKEDAYMQLGGMVFQAAKARDYWNRHLPGLNNQETDKDMFERAASYEAEFLTFVAREDRDFSPNPYQQRVLREFPEGLASARPGLHYEGRPFPDDLREVWLNGPPYPVDVYSLGKK